MTKPQGIDNQLTREQVRAHAGQWIAYSGAELVAAAPRLSELLALLETSTVSVYKVPELEELAATEEEERQWTRHTSSPLA